MLSDLDFVDLRCFPVKRGEVSSMAPSSWFERKVSEHGVELSDFGRDEAEEVILLTRKTRVSQGSPRRPLRLDRDLVDYRDTPHTHRYREDVRSLNAFLSRADIAFVDDGQEPRVDPFDRTLRRHFLVLPGQEERFDQGGRLFGGFWQPLRSERRASIRINGERVVVLDYGSMFTRLAYAEVGAEPPEGDLYAIPGLEDHRSGVKLAMNCFLFDGPNPRRSWPDELAVGDGDENGTRVDPSLVGASIKGRLPGGWGVGKTKKAILSVHPALKSAWGRHLGYRLMFRESEVLIAVLNSLVSQGIPALGLHDGLMVAVSNKEEAIAAMAKGAKDVAGISIPITEKPLSSPCRV
jgi:hypothetical protein